MSTTLNNKNVGDIVKIKENGRLEDFIIIQKGRPSSIYDSSCDGIWLMRRHCFTSLDINGTNYSSSDAFKSTNEDGSINNGLSNYVYSETQMHYFLKNIYPNAFETSFRNNIKTVKIPHQTSGDNIQISSGSNGLETKCFSLSCSEIGWTEKTASSGSSNVYSNEGSNISYFSSTANLACYEKGKFEINNDTPDSNLSFARWNLRSSYFKYHYENYSTYVDVYNNNWEVSYNFANYTYGYRPAFIVPGTLNVSDDNEVLTYIPSTINIPSTLKSKRTIPISWTASTFTSNPVYELYMASCSSSSELPEDRYTWEKIYEGTSLSTSVILPRNGYIRFKVLSKDSSGNKSPSSMSNVAILQILYPENIDAYTIESTWEEGSNMTISWQPVKNGDGLYQDITYKIYAIDSISMNTGLPHKLLYEGTNTSCTVPIPEGFKNVYIVTSTYDLYESSGMKYYDKYYQVIFKSKKAVITLTTPMISSIPIRSCLLIISGNIPNDTIHSCKITNNANDTNPIWENYTGYFDNPNIHIFSNETTNNGFAFNFEISVERGSSNIDAYISSIQAILNVNTQ